jgi:hypothetical protein
VVRAAVAVLVEPVPHAHDLFDLTLARSQGLRGLFGARVQEDTSPFGAIPHWKPSVPMIASQ